MRLFVCTHLAPENQAFYGRQMADLVRSSSGLLRQVPTNSFHITYAFLQPADHQVVAAIVDAVTAAAATHRPVAIRLAPPAILHARGEARLVCASIIDGGRDLSRLSADIVNEVERRLPDVMVSGSRSPHVTLARFRKHTRRQPASAVARKLRENAGLAERADLVGTVQVVSSELTSAAPRYDTLASIPLRDPGVSSDG